MAQLQRMPRRQQALLRDDLAAWAVWMVVTACVFNDHCVYTSFECFGSAWQLLSSQNDSDTGLVSYAERNSQWWGQTACTLDTWQKHVELQKKVGLSALK